MFFFNRNYCIVTVFCRQLMKISAFIQVLTSLGSLLAAIWIDNKDISKLINFDIYLQTLLFFTKHPSLVIFKHTIGVWNQFFKHKKINRNENIKSVINDWLHVISRKVCNLIEFILNSYLLF